MTEGGQSAAGSVNPARRRAWKRMILWGLATLALLLTGGLFGCWWLMIRMPGTSYRGPLPELKEPQRSLRQQLEQDITQLANVIGERNLQRYDALNQAADFVEQSFQAARYNVSRQEYSVLESRCYNIEAEKVGSQQPTEIVVVGAHYDSVQGTPGANDNASGVAALLALARAIADEPVARTLRFVAFANEEPPYFQTPDMGSYVYARRCRQRDENLVAVLSLETIGFYRQEPGSQFYPPPFSAFYPERGDFIAVVGNVGSRPLVHRVVESFRRHAEFPSEGGAAPGEVTGVGWSDHWSFWQEGYQAVMITDTALFRYPYYHTPEDTPDKLDYDSMTRVVDGLQGVVRELTNP